MTVKEQTDVIENGESIVIFVYDTFQNLYDGPNLESEPETQSDRTVLYVKPSYNFKKLLIGVK